MNNRAFWAAALAVALVPLVVPNSYVLGVLTTVGIYCIALIGLDLIKGYTGLLSLGQAGFMGVAAYVSGLLTTRAGWEPLAALPVAVGAVVLVALVMAVPGSRLTGFNLALATLGFVIITEGLFRGLRDWTGGATGLVGVPNFRVAGYVFASERDNFWLVWACCLVIFWLTHNLVHSQVGRALRAVRQDHLAAATMAIDVFRYKVEVFLIAAVYAGVAGSLYVHYMRFIAPDMVNWVVSTGLVTMLVLGGEGSLWGVFLGAALLHLLPEVFNPLQDYLMLLQGLVLVALMVYLPGGLYSLVGSWRRRVRRPGGTGRADPIPALVDKQVSP
ncbi:MAG TPA: branched-chain amino acid ABC transporter permease [Bacillota bacterium]